MTTQRDEQARRHGWSRLGFASAIVLLALPLTLGCELDRISGIEGEFDLPEDVVPEETVGEADEADRYRGSNDKEKDDGREYR